MNNKKKIFAKEIVLNPEKYRTRYFEFNKLDRKGFSLFHKLAANARNIHILIALVKQLNIEHLINLTQISEKGKTSFQEAVSNSNDLFVAVMWPYLSDGQTTRLTFDNQVIESTEMLANSNTKLLYSELQKFSNYMTNRHSQIIDFD